MTSILSAVNAHTKISLYSFSALCMLLFFYKAARHSNKSYGLLMILILIMPLFIASITELIALFYGRYSIHQRIIETLNKFASLWLISLALSHYHILKAFKMKYQRPHYKTFISIAILSSLAITGITSLQLIKDRIGDFTIIDLLDIGCLGWISYKTYHFREEVKFSPLSVIRDSASRLITFSAIQAGFAIIYLIQDSLDSWNDCFYSCSGDGLPLHEPDSTACGVLSLPRVLMYQGWVWLSLFSNWKLLFRPEDIERKANLDVLSNSSDFLNSTL